MGRAENERYPLTSNAVTPSAATGPGEEGQSERGCRVGENREVRGTPARPMPLGVRGHKSQSAPVSLVTIAALGLCRG